MPSFKNREEAVQNGYANRPSPISYRGFVIRTTDASGPHSYGYAYAIVIRPDRVSDLHPWSDDLPGSGKIYGHTQSVWLADARNAIGQPGAFAVLFEQEELAQAIESAKADIDAYYVGNADAVARLAAHDAWRATVDERHQQKRARRAARAAQ